MKKKNEKTWVAIAFLVISYKKKRSSEQQKGKQTVVSREQINIHRS